MSKTVESLILTSVLLLTGSSLMALQEAEKATAEMTFETFDMNHDGKLSSMEFTRLLESRGEIGATPKEDAEKKQDEFEDWDSNDDDSISFKEFLEEFSFDFGWSVPKLRPLNHKSVN